MSLFGSSGIRKVVDREFLQLACDVGLAVGSSYVSLVTACDTRTSSDAVRFAFLSGLLAAGAGASHAGVLPTPTLAYAARGYDAGAMITASHNPPQYNGIKLVNPDGSAFDPDQRRRVEEQIASGPPGTALWEDMGRCGDIQGVAEDHIERIVADFPRRAGLKVVVDCVCGAASKVTPRLLGRLGCGVVPLNCEPSGRFPRDIEPAPENLGDLARAVTAEKADLGIAHDGDADRIAIIDDRGRFIPQDRLMALLARQTKATKVVTTVDASMLIDDLGFEVVRTRVGDAFVSDELRRAPGAELDRCFGGESSGCFIFPRISLCPDAIYAAASVVQLAAEGPLSALVDRLPSYPVLRGAVAGDRDAMTAIESRLRGEQGAGAALDSTDGLRLSYSDGWLLVRPSGTEPKIRITAEAASETRAREIYDLGLKIVEDCLAQRERAAK